MRAAVAEVSPLAAPVRDVDMCALAEEVAAHYGVEPRLIFTRRKHAAVVAARQALVRALAEGGWLPHQLTLVLPVSVREVHRARRAPLPTASAAWTVPAPPPLPEGSRMPRALRLLTKMLPIAGVRRLDCASYRACVSELADAAPEAEAFSCRAGCVHFERRRAG